MNACITREPTVYIAETVSDRHAFITTIHMLADYNINVQVLRIICIQLRLIHTWDCSTCSSFSK